MKKLSIGVMLMIPLLLLINHRSGLYILVISHGESGEEIRELPIHPGDQWEIDFTHSWYRVPQKEIYVLDPMGGMVLNEVDFGSYPAALYYDEKAAQRSLLEGGFWKIKNMSRRIPEVRFKVGYTTDCRLTIRGDTFYFTSFADAGESLVLKATRASYGQYFLGSVLRKTSW